MKKLKLGIPKGSLKSNTVDLFKRAGWRISYDSRSYFPDIDDEEISCSLARAQEMSKYIEAGTLDLGLTGHDWVTENESDVVVVEDLVYSKVLAKPARWVLVVREDSPVMKIEDLQGKKISTELVSFTKRYFKERNIDVKVEFSWGATEAKVVESLVDAIVEVTETGSTIKANRLRIVHELMRTNTQLIANKDAWEDPWKRRKIEQIRTMLKGSLLGMGKVVIKMNVSKENLGRVILLLPSLKAPTISNLYNEEWFAVETVVDSSIIRDLIPLLQEAGAEGIIEYALNKVVVISGQWPVKDTESYFQVTDGEFVWPGRRRSTGRRRRRTSASFWISMGRARERSPQRFLSSITCLPSWPGTAFLT